MDTTNYRLDTHCRVQSTREAGQASQSTGGRRLCPGGLGEVPRLASATALDTDLLQKEQRLYDEWLSRQPPAVERREYPIPTAAARRPQPEGAAPELTCTERWAKIDAVAEAITPTVGTGADVDMAHTGVSGSDSKILNAAVGPCDAEGESVSAVLHARAVSLHGTKCGVDRERFGDRTNSAEKDTTANFGV
ncbi:hypothetical protein PC116_g17786 [Phytophthora cactorum]|uniref:Uncharacterized protein n=1 Tax=Phytophthora cactorum TaxID=29920 RepID=A0A329RPP3_9STRA|nr:hypothetical protein PC120_g15946 [Phytophthora cactorum]KAG3174074.1 hypothetical protein PC128_g18151 [Phytophthora cactorum]KAG3188400.1 hypothetical protein C6341_g2773 [Phytophthora cactorum]KAG4234050.1 hypothetical protein PC116_g17786 [Phytophthora cactorum]RAW26310.1 hypothetical protein PC110_g17281 [Phytophthora cactorum]